MKHFARFSIIDVTMLFIFKELYGYDAFSTGFWLSVIAAGLFTWAVVGLIGDGE